MRHSLLLLSFLTSLSLVACGGPSSEPVSAADAEAPCREFCEHDVACSEDAVDLEACVTDCVADVAGWVRADALEDFTACIADAACSADDQGCLGTCEPLDAHAAFESACRATLAGCFEPAELDAMCEVTPSASGGEEGFFCMIAPEIVDEFTACFDGEPACQAAVDCVEAAAEANGVDL